MWDAVKVVFRGKFIVLNTYIRKEEFNIYNLKFCHRQIEKVEFKSKTSRIKEII